MFWSAARSPPCGIVALAQVLGTLSYPTPLYAALLTVYRLGVLGDFDMYELEGQAGRKCGDLKENGDGELWPGDPATPSIYVPVQALFYIVTIAIGIFLMNILVS